MLQCPTYTGAFFTVEVWGQMCLFNPCTCSKATGRALQLLEQGEAVLCYSCSYNHVSGLGSLSKRHSKDCKSHIVAPKVAPKVANGCLIGTSGGLKHTIRTATHTLINSQVRYCLFTLTLNYCHKEHSEELFPDTLTFGFSHFVVVYGLK